MNVEAIAGRDSRAGLLHGGNEERRRAHRRRVIFVLSCT
jgi:hypothetical protein